MQQRQGEKKTAGETLQKISGDIISRSPARRPYSKCGFEGNSLVEEVVVHFDLGVGLEVIGHEHDGDLNVT